MSALSAATRVYEEGDTILVCAEPLVHVTKYEHRLFTCEQCMRRVRSTIACPKCRKVYYCSVPCQDRAWDNIHRLECPILATHKPLQFESNGIDYMQRLTLRLYLLMTECPEVRTQLFGGRRLDDMECHSEQLKDSAQFGGIVNYFKLYRIEPVDRELLLRCYGILHVNSFGIDRYCEPEDEHDDQSIGGSSDDRDVQIDHVGTGLYVEASVFDHSCVPNAAASGDALGLEIRALSRIEPGQQIYIDYLQDVMPREDRQRTLSERYFFRCECELGCADAVVTANAAFDHSVDFKRYAVLNRVIDSLLHQSTNTTNTTNTTEATERNEVNWRQLNDCWRQRLRLQQCYYAAAGHHPCLSLFYREYLRFLLVNQRRLVDSNADHRNNGAADKTATTPSIKQQQQSSNNNATSQPSSSSTTTTIEQDLLEFGGKTKQHLTITHGINHSFYSRLFGTDANDRSLVHSEPNNTAESDARASNQKSTESEQTIHNDR